MKVFYLGPAGTFGEQAALDYVKRTGIDAQFIPLSYHPEIVAAVDEATDALGVVANEQRFLIRNTNGDYNVRANYEGKFVDNKLLVTGHTDKIQFWDVSAISAAR